MKKKKKRKERVLQLKKLFRVVIAGHHMSNNRSLSPASGLKRNLCVGVGKRENRFLCFSFFFFALQLRALSHALSNRRGKKAKKHSRRKNRQAFVERLNVK